MRRIFPIIIFILLSGFLVKIQAQDSSHASKWGPNDTIIVPAIIYNGEVLPYSELEMIYVSKLPPDKLAKVLEAYNRLRNAVYVTYPYARVAGIIINDVNTHLIGVNSKSERKKYIKS